MQGSAPRPIPSVSLIRSSPLHLCHFLPWDSQMAAWGRGTGAFSGCPLTECAPRDPWELSIELLPCRAQGSNTDVWRAQLSAVGTDGNVCSGAKPGANPVPPHSCRQVPSTLRARWGSGVAPAPEAQGGKRVGARAPSPRGCPCPPSPGSRRSRPPTPSLGPPRGAEDPRKAVFSCLCFLQQDLFGSRRDLCHWQLQWFVGKFLQIPS